MAIRGLKCGEIGNSIFYVLDSKAMLDVVKRGERFHEYHSERSKVIEPFVRFCESNKIFAEIFYKKIKKRSPLTKYCIRHY